MINNIMERDNSFCTGCGVCAAICPNNAIMLTLNEDGYYIANVEPDKCIQCGKCQNVCAKFEKAENNSLKEPKKMFVGTHIIQEKQRACASGGAGEALAEAALENGYDVIGAALDMNKMRVKHIVINKAEDLKIIRGSKYVPSYTLDAFKLIESLPKVVIFALPCQMEALRRAYGNRDGLIMVDLRCAGPSGYNLLDKYAEYLAKKNSSGMKEFSMRSKEEGWFMGGPKTYFKDGSCYFENKHHDLFALIFNQLGAVHQVCWNCDALKNLSAADIRIEDAWHQMEKISKREFVDGISQISTYTTEGEVFLQEAAKYFKIREVELEKYHTFLKKKEPILLMQLLQDKEKSLPEIYHEYRKTISIKRKIRWKLEYIVSKNRTIYNGTRRIYKCLFKH